MSLWKILIAIAFLIIVVVLMLLFTNWGNEILVRLVPRPQEPNDRPYVIKEVSFPGGVEGVTLAGELTMPREDGPFPAIIMITGSGPQDRNEEVAGHKPFLVFSDYMTRRGYAVLRYDDRGFAQSSGDFQTATTKDFATDAAAAMRWLKLQANIDVSRIGYVGHSEGGYIAPLAAEEENAAFLILLAGPAKSLNEVALKQNTEFAKLEGMDEKQINDIRTYAGDLLRIFRYASTPEEANQRAWKLFNARKKSLGSLAYIAEESLKHQPSTWLMWLINYDPIPALKAFSGPVLAVFGDKDIQVSASDNAPIMEKVLSNSHSRVLTFPNLNHLFQPTETGAMSEYWWKTTTFDEQAMKAIADWMDELGSDQSS